MQFGLTLRLRPLNRRYLANQLREAISVARQLGMVAVEFSCTEEMAALGLPHVFGGEFMEMLLHARDLRFHLRLYHGEQSIDEVAMSDTSRRARAIYLRKLCAAIEFFEQSRPLQLYLLSAGPKIADAATHLTRLVSSITCLRTLYPDLHFAFENGRPGTVLEHGPELLDFLNATGDVAFIFDTGYAYQSVGFSRELFAHVVTGAARFTDRLAGICWRNVGPMSRADVPLHVAIERGVDLGLVARYLGRNPSLVHMIANDAACEPAVLARDRRALAGLLHRG